jgi:hypothetical protein
MGVNIAACGALAKRSQGASVSEAKTAHQAPE